MNIQRLKTLRDHIATEEASRFDMSTFYKGVGDLDKSKNITHNCGTAACIAGWAAALFKPEMPVGSISSYTIGPVLGLTDEQATELFVPPGYNNKSRYNRASAIATLDHLIETGEVKWQFV